MVGTDGLEAIPLGYITSHECCTIFLAIARKCDLLCLNGLNEEDKQYDKTQQASTHAFCCDK